MGFAVPIANVLEILGISVAAGTTPVETTGSGNTITVEVQTSQAIAATDATKIGLAAFDSGAFNVDANGLVTLASGSGAYSPATWVVDPVVGKGNFTTITAAVAASSAGDTIFVRPGTYTENVTITSAISICALNQISETSAPVIISGKVTNSSTARVYLSNLYLQTNSDYCLSNTSSGVIFAVGCVFNATSNTAILNSSTGTCIFRQCLLRHTNPYVIYENTSTGGLQFWYCQTSVAGATVNYNNSTGAVSFLGCGLQMNLSTSGAGSITMDSSTITQAGQGVNGLIDLNGSGGCSIRNSFLRHGGVLAVLNIQAGRTCTVYNTNILTGAAAVITGAGSLTYGALTFTNSRAMTVTTQSVLPWLVAEGGTGAITFNANGVVVSGTTTTSALAAVTLTNGQMAIGSTGASPAAGTITSTGGTITVTTGAGTLNLEVATGGVPWTDVTGATQTLAISNGYATDRGGGVTYTLPSTAAFGDVIMIVGKAGLATVAQNALQAIIFGSSTTTIGVGGSIVSTNAGDCVTLRCTTSGTSTRWVVQSSVGSWTIV